MISRWIIALPLLTAPLRVQAQDAPVAPARVQTPVTISAQLSKTAFKADEPVEVTLLFTNTSDKEVPFGVDRFGKSQFSVAVDVRDERGQPVQFTLAGQDSLRPHPWGIWRLNPIVIPPKGQQKGLSLVSRDYDLSGGGRFTLVASHTENGATVRSAPLEFSVEPAQAVSIDQDAPVSLAAGLLLQARLQHDINLWSQPLPLEVQVAAPSLVQVEVLSVTDVFDHPDWPRRLEPRPMREAGRRVLPLHVNHSARLDLRRAFDLTMGGKFRVRVLVVGAAPVELDFLG